MIGPCDRCNAEEGAKGSEREEKEVSQSAWGVEASAEKGMCERDLGAGPLAETAAWASPQVRCVPGIAPRSSHSLTDQQTNSVQTAY